MRRKNWTLRNKIFVALFLLTLFFISMIGIVIDLTYDKSLRQNEVNYNVLVTDQLQSEFDNEIESVQHLAKFLSTNEDITAYVGSGSKKNERNVDEFLNHIVTIQSELESIQVLCKDGNTSTANQIFDDSSIKQFYNQLCAGSEGPFWTDSRKIRASNKSITDVLSYVYPIEISSQKGFVVLNISYDSVDQFLVNYAIQTDEKAFICNSSGNIILNYPNSTSYEPLLKSNPEFLKLDNVTSYGKVFGVDSVIVSKSLNNNGWTLVRIIATNSITGQSSKMRKYLQILLLVCVVLSLLTAIVIAKALTKPIHELSTACKNVKNGNLSYQLTVHEHDEFGQLKNTFNLMLAQIRQLLQKEVESEQQKSNLRFQILQEQINPHFLYNTLDSIRWLAAMQNESRIPEMTTALINLLKYNLSSQNVAVLSKEIESVKNYIKIQKFRYLDTFNVTFQIGKSTENCEVIKFILQPLVENSILHGFNEKEQRYEIKISSEIINDELHIMVIDNGSGMSPEKVMEVNCCRAEMNSTGHRIGIRNIQERLKLFVGEKYGLHYTSAPYSETVAEIVLPVKRCLPNSTVPTDRG